MEDDGDADTCILKFSDTELHIPKRTMLRILDPKKTEPNRYELIEKHRLLMEYQRREESNLTSIIRTTMANYLPFVKRFLRCGSYLGMGKLTLGEEDYEIRIGRSYIKAHAIMFAFGHWFAFPTLKSEAYENLTKRIEVGGMSYDDIWWASKILDAVFQCQCRGFQGPAAEQMNEVSDRLRQVKLWKLGRETEKLRQGYGGGRGLRWAEPEGWRAGIYPALCSRKPMEVCLRIIRRG